MYRWADPTFTAVRRDSDGATIPRAVTNGDFSALLAAGVSQQQVDETPDLSGLLVPGVSIAAYQRFATLEAAKAALTSEVESRARALRFAVAGTDDATKLAVYREKYDVAVAALTGDGAALGALTQEAAARGQTPGELATLVKSLGDAWRTAGLAIDAASGAHKTTIAALATLEAAETYDVMLGWPALS